MGKPGWDLTSINSLTSAAEWLRKGSGALLVLVIRPADVAFAVDGDVAAAAAVALVEQVMPEAMEQVQMKRSAAKAGRKRL